MTFKCIIWIIRKTKTGPKIKLIDFEWSKKIPNKANLLGLKYELKEIQKSLEYLCKTNKEKEELKKYFQKEYEKAANKIM